MDAENIVNNTALAAAAFSFVAILVTVWGILKTLRATLRQNSANLVMELEKEYTIHRRWARVDLARRLQDSARQNKQLRLNVQDEPLLTWFETIGYLTRTKILDRGMVWNKFFWELERYYLAMTQYSELDDLRKTTKCPTLYQELEWLYWHLLAEEDRQNRSRPRMSVRRSERVSPKEIDSFIAGEANLDLDRAK